MSEITETTAHEAYAFACMRCGHGWEQAYEIEHHVDASGQAFVVYKADGERVPSPLSNPSCMNCGGHVIRIMRSGRVSSVQNLLYHPERVTTAPATATTTAPATTPASALTTAAAPEPLPAPVGGASPAPHHHWHLSDLLHPFHRK
ncbi:hypothetical protein OG204_14570 [Streptomyces sp. NBC_01387]|uniref:hypothetical protein n=1 Tax=unclassified Streptomyces TaxID=2593676 RepID=UPI0032466658